MKNSAKMSRLLALATAGLLVAAVTLGACSEDDDPSTGPNWGDVGTDDDLDAGDDIDDVDDADADDDQDDPEPGPDLCEDVDCPDGEVCAEGECFEETSTGYSCADPFDFGTIGGGDVVSQEADPRFQPNVITASCATPDADSPQAVFRFDVDEPVVAEIDVEITTDGVITALNQDIRIGSCTDSDATDQCDTDTREWFAEPGEDYYIIVEARDGREIAGLELTIETEAMACFPAGDRSCDGDELVQCYAGEEERVFSCADECIVNDEEEDECTGDVCSQAVEIRESKTVNANMGAYSGHFDVLHPDAGCVDNPDDFSEYGRDLVFELPDLTAGETVELTPPTQEPFVVGLLESCSMAATDCLAADSSGNPLEWEVEEPGDYYVVFYQGNMASEEVEFGIQID